MAAWRNDAQSPTDHLGLVPDMPSYETSVSCDPDVACVTHWLSTHRLTYDTCVRSYDDDDDDDDDCRWLYVVMTRMNDLEAKLSSLGSRYTLKLGRRVRGYFGLRHQGRNLLGTPGKLGG